MLAVILGIFNIAAGISLLTMITDTSPKWANMAGPLCLLVGVCVFGLGMISILDNESLHVPE